MKLILHWLILTASVFAAAHFIPGIQVSSLMTALIVGAVLSFINLIIRPVITILTIPINILTLGLFSLVVNGFFFWMVSKVVAGFEVKTFTAGIIGALVVSILNWIGNMIFMHHSTR